MTETNPRKRAEIVSSFTDAGTGESFTAGDTPMIDAGAFANYEHAGLVRAPVPTKPAAPKRAAAKPARSRTRRAAAPSPAPAAPASAEPAAAPDAGGSGAGA